MLILIRFAKTCMMHVMQHREGKEQDFCLDCPLSGSQVGLKVLQQSQSKFWSSGVFERRNWKRRTNVSVSRVQMDVLACMVPGTNQISVDAQRINDQSRQSRLP